MIPTVIAVVFVLIVIILAIVSISRVNGEDYTINYKYDFHKQATLEFCLSHKFDYGMGTFAQFMQLLTTRDYKHDTTYPISYFDIHDNYKVYVHAGIVAFDDKGFIFSDRDNFKLFQQFLEADKVKLPSVDTLDHTKMWGDAVTNPITDFCEAFYYLNKQPEFIEPDFRGSVDEGDFLNHTNIMVVKVNPKTFSIDDDVEKNTLTQVWLEPGTWEYSEDTKKIEAFHHYQWDCGGNTFEEAVLKLANMIKREKENKKCS